MTFLVSLMVAMTTLLSLTARADQNLIRGQFILIDTLDEAQCLNIQQALVSRSNLEALSDLKELCVNNPRQPIASVVIAEPVPQYTMQTEINFEALTPAQQNLLNDTRQIALDGRNSDGVLYVLPQSLRPWGSSSLSRSSAKPFYFIQRHGPNSPLRDFRTSTLSLTFFWEQNIATRSPLKSMLKSSNNSLLYFEFFRSLQNIFAIARPKVSLQNESNSVSMIVINPESGAKDSVKSLFDVQVSKRSRVRLLTRDPALNVPALNPDNEQSSSPDFQFKSKDGMVRQTFDALQQYFLRESYWGLEIQFRF